MGFIGITSEPFEIVAHTAVDVAVERNTLFPITFAVLIATVLIMLGDFEHCGVQVSVTDIGKLLDCFHEEHFIASSDILIDVGENCVVTDFSDHTKRKEVTSTFTFVYVSDCPGGKLSAVSAVFDFHNRPLL